MNMPFQSTLPSSLLDFLLRGLMQVHEGMYEFRAYFKFRTKPSFFIVTLEKSCMPEGNISNMIYK